MLTVKEVAAILNISPGLVYALVSQGMIEHERFGTGRGTIRITEEALNAYRERTSRRGRLSVSRPTSTGSGFRELDAGRLRAAWRERGVRT